MLVPTSTFCNVRHHVHHGVRKRLFVASRQTRDSGPSAEPVFPPLLQDACSACGGQPLGEFVQEPVVELIVTDGSWCAAGMEETGVVDDPAGRDREGVEFMEERELVVVGVAEADELPEQGRRAALHR